jgi:hypothetical protein
MLSLQNIYAMVTKLMSVYNISICGMMKLDIELGEPRQVDVTFTSNKYICSVKKVKLN